MIKFLAHDKTTGAPMYGFGLSDHNLDNLKAGKPIHIHLSEMDPSLRGEILILWGPTEQELTAQLAGWIGPDTEIRSQDLHKEHL